MKKARARTVASDPRVQEVLDQLCLQGASSECVEWNNRLEQQLGVNTGMLSKDPIKRQFNTTHEEWPKTKPIAVCLQQGAEEARPLE